MPSSGVRSLKIIAILCVNFGGKFEFRSWLDYENCTFNSFCNSDLSFTDDIESVSMSSLSHNVFTFLINSLKVEKHMHLWTNLTVAVENI